MSFILLGILNSQAAGAGAGVAGYVAGGNNQTTVDKFAFPDETRTTLATGLSNAVEYNAGFSDPGVAGYNAGGDTGSGYISTVDKFAFPSDSRSSLATGLPQDTAFFKGMSNAGVAGYTLGGFVLGGVDEIDDVYKFAFPSDSRSTLASGLSTNRYSTGGFSDVAVAGYSGGGRNDNIGTFYSTVDKFAFPSDSRSTLATGLSSAESYLGGMSNNGVAGYIAGDDTNTRTAVDKFAFPSDTRTTLGTGLSVGRKAAAGYSNHSVAGYFAGSDTTANIDRFAFPSDTRTTAAAGLSSVREYPAGFQDA